MGDGPRGPVVDLEEGHLPFQLKEFEDEVVETK